MCASLVHAVGDGVSGCVDDVGEDTRSDGCNRGSICNRRSSVGQRDGCGRSVPQDLTPHAMDDGVASCH
jgi:hypothetical protein